MKKQLSSLSFVLCCATALGNDGYYSGAYLSVGVGAIDNTFTFNQSATVAIDGNDNKILLSGSDSGNELSVSGNIDAGYRRDITPMINLGIEFDASFESASIDSTNRLPNEDKINFSNHIQTKLTNGFAILFKPGVTFNQQKTLLYLLVGPQWGKFSSSTSTLFTDTSETEHPVVGMTSTSQSDEYKSGWTFGLGAEHYLNDDFHIGIEYQYTDYGSVYSSDTTSDVFKSGGIVGSISSNGSTDAYTNTILIKLTKQFG